MTAPVRRRAIRAGNPCPECGSERCGSINSFACWIRAYKGAFHEHGYCRSHGITPMLRKAGLPILAGPQTSGSEALYAPTWAVIQLTALRASAKETGKRLGSPEVTRILRLDSRYSEKPPAALLERLDSLRAFALLRGWRFEHGAWYR